MAYEKKLEVKNMQDWRLGMYIRDSICSSFVKDAKYPEKPYGMNEESENNKINDADIFESWSTVFNRNFQEKNGGGS